MEELAQKEEYTDSMVLFLERLESVIKKATTDSEKIPDIIVLTMDDTGLDFFASGTALERVIFMLESAKHMLLSADTSNNNAD